MLTDNMASLNTAVDNLLGDRRKLEEAIKSNNEVQIRTASDEFNKQLAMVHNYSHALRRKLSSK
jgi:hypothetical protein